MSTGQAPRRREPNVQPIPGTHEPGFKEQPIVQQPMPPQVEAATRIMGGTALVMNIYRMGECSIIMAREQAAADGTFLWHLSISCTHRHPTWDEIKVARYRLLPLELTMGMLLPPPENYVNVQQQDHVFHLWEITDPRSPWEGK